jgi:hypothetical protein
VVYGLTGSDPATYGARLYNGGGQLHLMTDIAQWIIAVATAFYTVVALVTAIIVYRTLRQGRRSQEAQIFLEISSRYNKIYFARNELMKTDRDWMEIYDKYTSYEELINSQEWKTLREVAACFELMGILVKHNLIRREVLFDMVLVNPPDTPAHGERKLWDRVEKFIKRARKHNPNQWVNWEDLVKAEEDYYKSRKQQDANDRK